MVEAMRKVLSVNQFNKLNEELDKVKYKCKCGHRVVIPYFMDKNIKVVFSGRDEPLPKKVIETRDKLVEMTKDNTGGIFKQTMS